MKVKFQYIALFVLMLTSAACKKDNYAAPSITLKGQLMYNGTPIGVEYNQVPFELYQTGYAGNAPITGTFDQDGTYSVLTFKGNYKFTMKSGQGPFLWKELPNGGRDTIRIALTGNQTVNIEVTPYYMIRDAQISSGSGKITANFSIDKIINDPSLAHDIESVGLYVNKTQFVSRVDQAAETETPGASLTSMSNISISVGIPNFTVTQNYVYARVGIKIAGVEDMIFSPVTKVSY